MRSAAARFAVGGQSLAAFGTHSTGDASPPDPNALPQGGCHVGDLGAGCVAPRSYTRSNSQCSRSSRFAGLDARQPFTTRR